MRVIAGQYRGRPIVAPAGVATRPILDRTKAGLFDWLGARLARPGVIPPVNVLDVFCGGGSLGIECLSRGAGHATFVESDRRALAALGRNIAGLNIDAATVVKGPAESALIPPPPGDAFGLVFLDPPYRLNDDLGDTTIMGRLFRRLDEEIPTTAEATIVWRHPRTFTPPPRVGRLWPADEARAWGTMAVTIYQRGR